jgi:hypothetical protein
VLTLSRRRPVIGIEMFSSAGWTGGGIYLRNLIYCLAALPKAEQPVVCLLNPDAADPDTLRELRQFALVDAHLASNKPSGVVSFGGRIWNAGTRIVTGRSGTLRIPKPQLTYPGVSPPVAGAVQARWIPDFQHFHLPEFFSEEERERRTRDFGAIAALRTMLILSSNAALRDFWKFFPDTSVTPRVWSFCTVLTEHEKGGRNPRETWGLPDRYLYVANQFWRHKDHETVLRALAILRDRGLRIELVCTGLERDTRMPGLLEELMRLVDDLGLSQQVKTLGMVPRNDQIEIFRHATAVVQPSLFEGWSTVVEDAKALGLPIVLSDLPVHKEQTEALPNAWIFARRDPKALADRLEEIWPTLPTRPNLAAESAAAIRQQQRVLAAGRRFASLASEAIQLFVPRT